MKSSKNSRSVLPAFFISKATACPAGHEKVEITKELPGEIVITPKPCETEGTLLNVVELLTVCESLPTAILPSPVKLNEVVTRSSFLGNRKTRLQVLPDNDDGISKLKVVETVELMVPLSPVPWVISGLAESIRTIR